MDWALASRALVLLGAVAAVGTSGCFVNSIAALSPDNLRQNRPAPAVPTPTVVNLAVSSDAPSEDRQVVEELSSEAAFFETGKSTLSKEAKVKLLRVAEALRRNPDMRIRIEGNADERGSGKYNRELAERRARATRDYLVSVNVNPDQVTVVSNGADKPLAPGHSEEHWEVNRRTDLIPVVTETERRATTTTSTSTTVR